MYDAFDKTPFAYHVTEGGEGGQQNHDNLSRKGCGSLSKSVDIISEQLQIVKDFLVTF